MNKLRVFEAFSGVGTQSMALKRLGVDYEVVGIAEIDKFAIQSYMAIHGETKNYGDISKINPTELPDMDLFTYSFPCQDLSIAGRQKGMSEGTRSGLLYECEKVIATKKPKYLLLENVKNLVGKKFKPDFDKWLEWLSSQGYTNYWKVLNAKDYGVPQNRERVFVVSILGDEIYEFPDSSPLDVRLKDILEDSVDDKYLLSDEYLQRFISSTKTGKYPIGKVYNVIGSTVGAGKGTNSRHWIYDTNSNIGTLSATDYKQPKQIVEYDFPKPFPLEVKLKDVLEDEVDEKYYFDKDYHRAHEVINQVAKESNENIIPCDSTTLKPKKLEVSNCITARYNAGIQAKQSIGVAVVEKKETPDYRIRRLTPLECWRLMGITDEDFYKAKAAGVSDSQLYKQAGNAIVVDVLVSIFRNLFDQRKVKGEN